MMVKASDLLTATEAAVRLGICRWHVSHLCRQGVFPGALKLTGSRAPWLIPAKDLPRYETWCETRVGRQGRPPWHKPAKAPRRRPPTA